MIFTVVGLGLGLSDLPCGLEKVEDYRIENTETGDKSGGLWNFVALLIFCLTG